MPDKKAEKITRMMIVAPTDERLLRSVSRMAEHLVSNGGKTISREYRRVVIFEDGSEIHGFLVAQDDFRNRKFDNIKGIQRGYFNNLLCYYPYGDNPEFDALTYDIIAESEVPF